MHTKIENGRNLLHAGSLLEERLRRWRRELALSVLTEGGAKFLTVSTGALLAFAVLDTLLVFSLGVRWILFGVWVCLAAVTFYAHVIIPLLRLRPVAVFREVTRRLPELKPFLVPAWELSHASFDAHTSQALAWAHVEQTEHLLSREMELPVRPAWVSHSTKRGLLYFAISAGIVLPWLWRASPGIDRILAPWRTIPLNSLLEVSPGNARVPWGTPVAIEARFRREKENSISAKFPLTLWMRGATSSWNPVVWDREDRARFSADGSAEGRWTHSYRVENLTHPMQYQVRWRDLRGSVYSIEPAPYPQLETVQMRLYAPGHAKQQISERSLEGMSEILGPQGSWIALSGRPNMPLSKAQLRVSYLSGPVELKSKPSGIYEAGFPLTQEGSFHFELVSADGMQDPRPIEYELKILTDEPPMVELLSPAFEIQASPRDPLLITYEAHDDYGLTAVDLVFWMNGKQQETPIQRFTEQSLDQIGNYSWDISRLPIGAKVEFQIRATDNRAAHPQFAFSKKGIVYLVDLEAAHVSVERRWIAAEKQLDRLADKEAEAQRLAQSLSRAPSAAETERLKAAMKAVERELAQQWSQAQQSLEEMADAMSKDPYSNAGMAQQTRSLAEDFKSIKEGQWPKAVEASRQNRWGEAEKRHAGLEAQARKAKRLLTEGKQLQAMQDLWSEAQRMEQGGSDLSAALESMAARPDQVTAEQKRELDKALSKLAAEIEALRKVIESIPKPRGSSSEDQRKAYVLPLNAAKQAADSLQKALAAGDYASAAQMAKRLAEELSRVRQAISDAARSSAAGGASGGGSQSEMPSQKMESTMPLWQEAIEAQSKSLSAAQKLDEERLKRLLEAQKSLLESLARRQKVVMTEARGLESMVPAETLSSMDAVLREFESKSVVRAPQLLPQIVQRFKVQALALPQNLRGRAPELNRLGDEEQEILDELNRGVSSPAPGDTEKLDAAAASSLQEQARRKAGQLRDRLESLRLEVSTLPQDVLDSVDEAQGEQGEALDDLKRLESSGAVKHEGKALELLEQGMKNMSSATEQQKKMEQQMGGSFSGSGSPRRSGMPVRQNTGADTGFVPLPSAKDYQPPEEIRKNVEQSLQERRPKSYDQVIKDYFKRISQ